MALTVEHEAILAAIAAQFASPAEATAFLGGTKLMAKRNTIASQIEKLRAEQAAAMQQMEADVQAKEAEQRDIEARLRQAVG